MVNATEPKKLTNHRASGSDDASRIAPKTLMTLEECMEYIQQDECIEVTPKNIRMRKVILDDEERKRQQKKLQTEGSLNFKYIFKPVRIKSGRFFYFMNSLLNYIAQQLSTYFNQPYKYYK